MHNLKNDMNRLEQSNEKIMRNFICGQFLKDIFLIYPLLRKFTLISRKVTKQNDIYDANFMKNP